MEEIEVQCLADDDRALHATRARVDELLAQGWSIVGRDPVVMQRGRAKLEIKANGAIVYG